MVARLVVLLVVLGAAAGVARAQPGEAEPPVVAPAPAPVPPGELTGPATVDENTKFPDVIVPPPGFDRDPAWTAYDGAFREAAAGNPALAKTRLAEIAMRWPAHPAADRAGALAERLQPRRRDPRKGDKVARGELVFWSTLGGLSLALQLCEVIDCESDRAYAGVFTLSIGGALAVSLLATRKGVQPGEAQLYNSAQTWGLWNGFLIGDDIGDTANRAAVTIAMQAGGLAAGIGLWQTWRPSAGDVALTNTFFLWGTVMTVWGHLIADEEPALRTVVLAGDAALVIGALVSREVEMSRGRTLLIDVGGIIGTLVGGLVAVATEDEQGAGVALLVGGGAGIALAVAGSSDWDKPKPVKVTPTLVTGPGRSVGVGFGAAFAF